jgi:RNA polymerase sigma-70 factor (ECF subfamily)
MRGMATHPNAVATLQPDLESYRRELTGYCYRMLGSGFEAEDAVQETMVRAWKNVERLETPAALRSWLYRIATNVCLDMQQSAQRRARPMDLSSPSTADSQLGAPLPETTWLQPIADARVLPPEGDPAELAAARESIRLAFVAALQHLPPKQRAVLILCEVLKWKASEAAELLDTSVASVNSALQRARATLDAAELDEDEITSVTEEEQQDLLTRYVDAFQRYDVAHLVTLLHDDATFQMPPFELWLRGPDQVAQWMLGPGIECRSAKLRTTSANGCPAVGIYKPDADGVYRPFNLAVLGIANGKIVAIDNFLYPELFPEVGLPAELTD